VRDRPRGRPVELRFLRGREERGHRAPAFAGRLELKETDMGEIVGAGLVAHVPTIMLPEDVRKELNDGKEISLVPGLKRLRTEVFDRLQPDTIVVFDTHWETTFEHIVTSAERRSGHFTSSELPRGMAGIPYDIPGDPELAAALEKKAAGRDDTWILAWDDP